MKKFVLVLSTVLVSSVSFSKEVVCTLTVNDEAGITKSANLDAEPYMANLNFGKVAGKMINVTGVSAPDATDSYIQVFQNEFSADGTVRVSNSISKDKVTAVLLQKNSEGTETKLKLECEIAQ